MYDFKINTFLQLPIFLTGQYLNLLAAIEDEKSIMNCKTVYGVYSNN